MQNRAGNLSVRWFWSLPCLPGICLAQVAGPSITSGPVAATASVPLVDPLALGLLLLTLAAVGVWFLRQGHAARKILPLLAIGAIGGAVMLSPRLMAQVTASFTNPSGETLSIAIAPIAVQQGIAGFEPDDFIDNAGANLTIVDLTPPDFAQCFPNNSVGMLLPPGSTPPSPYPNCIAGLELTPGNACRVDVDTICRNLAAANLATISVTPTLQFAVGGTGNLTVSNAANSPLPAQNVAATIPGGSAISVQSTDCPSSLAAGASCTITLAASATEGPTTVSIAGDNTNIATADVTVVAALNAAFPSSGTASGGTGITLTGTALTGATAVTFGGIAATSVNVVNSTTVTAVTPAHATGSVDIIVATPAGGATLVNGYTYLATAIGQPSGGGVIAALGGGLNNLIAATADNSTGIEWGGLGTAAGAGAQSDTDGAGDTASIVAALGNNAGTPYAAQLCTDHEVDSQGNTPCQAGNACYNDWYTPAKDQLNQLYLNQAAIGGFANASYWSSTEYSANPATTSWGQDFAAGAQLAVVKSTNLRVRCVRSFTP
ncbi:MAG: midcut-by-XrtH protein [Rudaea sp.]